MAQLKRLPVDALKIDQTFVAGLGIDAGDQAIVATTVRRLTIRERRSSSLEGT
jgi:EAL domain-containing protein (putative c-di-GMP-specific phosphodiesterase class I)